MDRISREREDIERVDIHIQVGRGIQKGIGYTGRNRLILSFPYMGIGNRLDRSIDRGYAGYGDTERESGNIPRRGIGE